MTSSAAPVLPIARRRIDWSVLPGVVVDAPVWGDGPAPPDLLVLVSSFLELFEIETVDTLLRRGVELALELVGLTRAGLYLYDAPADLMLGTWGTDFDGRIVDEHHAMFTLGKAGRRVFHRALSGEAPWTVIDRCPLIDLRDQSTQVIGEGWVVCTPIRAGNRCLGMLYNDSGRSGAGIDVAKQTQTAILCAFLGAALRARQHSNQFKSLPSTTARHPTLRKAVHLLTRDPTLRGEQLANMLDVSLSRIARLFKEEMGISLVDYRNQLRLERFAELVERPSTSLLQAALEAGFGSYAQFHRVFRAANGKPPREYLMSQGIRLPRRNAS